MNAYFHSLLLKVPFFFQFYFPCMNVLSACVYALHACGGVPQRPEESIGNPGTIVTGICELPCGCWKTNMGLLQEQQTFLANDISV